MAVGSTGHLVMSAGKVGFVGPADEDDAIRCAR